MAPPRPVVTVFGDSLVDEAADFLRYFGSLEGAEVRVRSQGGTALCDWRAEAERAVADPQVDAVALAFTGNNLTPCAAGLVGPPLGDRYADDARAVMASARGAVPVLWVTGPASWYDNPNGDLVAARITATATEWPDARAVDGAAAISPGGVWSRTQPCLAGEPCTGPVVDGVRTNLVRAPDGIHFCPTGKPSVGGRTRPCGTYSSGARRYAVAILGPLLAAARGPAGVPVG
ncbi:MAG: hypothetical protein JWN67_2945 [Actinomycetia bacterium]|nr:hypothetical protein [Actinomycetes bacterium]